MMSHFTGEQAGNRFESGIGKGSKIHRNRRGESPKKNPWPVAEFSAVSEIVADPNDLIDSIVDAIDYAEIAHDDQGLIKARRLLKNDLRQAIDFYVKDEVSKALDRSSHPQRGRKG